MTLIWANGELKVLNRVTIYALLVEKHERRERFWARAERCVSPIVWAMGQLLRLRRSANAE